MLVIVKHRNIESFLKDAFDLEALRRANVLELDAAKRRSHRLHYLYETRQIGKR